ncbi:MAG: M13-type metalloendopeptidase [Thermoguttaceae bacterium]
MKRTLCFAMAASLLIVCLTSAMRSTSVASEKPLVSGIDMTAMDKNVRPQDDLFRAVNGAWLAKAKIAPDHSSEGVFLKVAEQTQKDLREIIETCANAKDNTPGSERQKIGDMYASYMDDGRAEQLGIKPIAATLATIDRIETKPDLIRSLAELERAGVSGPVACHVNTDAKDSARTILYLYQHGLGLPERNYYWDAKFSKKLAAYAAHVERMLTLAKIPDAKQAAADIVAFETQLAKAQWSKLECRDTIKTYNKKTLAELSQLAPEFDWARYFETVGAGSPQEVIVAQPSYVAGMARLVDAVPLATWKAWLKWKVVHAYASLLNKELADADFAFYGTVLHGTPKNRDRWKRAIGAVEGTLGEAIGKIYVEKHFPPEAKARMDRMVANIIAAYGQAFRDNQWMGSETKRKALAKLAMFTPKIGYPKKWRDYSRLEIRRDDLVGNIQRATIFEWDWMLAKLGKPVDRDEWHMTPQTVNAYYNPHMNEIVFPAAILQPPFFNLAADDAVNYGGIGAVIGHEIGHGFDDQGSKWDGAGNLVDWWTKADRAEFDKRGAMLVAQYDQFEPFPGFRVNGKFTLGENIGDLSGMTIAHAAYRASLGSAEAPLIDGLTGDQRFFMGFAQVWRCKYREDDMKNRLLVDPHSPAEYRANGTPRNVPSFYSAFGVKPGDKMYLPPEKRVTIW